VISSGLRYGMMFKMIQEQKEFTDCVARPTAPPVVQRAEAKEAPLNPQHVIRIGLRHVRI
jgi:hypothetical protein